MLQCKNLQRESFFFLLFSFFVCESALQCSLLMLWCKRFLKEIPNCWILTSVLQLTLLLFSFFFFLLRLLKTVSFLLPVVFIFIPLLETHPGFTAVITLAMPNVLTYNLKAPCASAVWLPLALFYPQSVPCECNLLCDPWLLPSICPSLAPYYIKVPPPDSTTA